MSPVSKRDPNGNRERLRLTRPGISKLNTNPYQPPNDTPPVDSDPISIAKRRLSRPATALVVMSSIHSVLVSISLFSFVLPWFRGSGGVTDLIPIAIAFAQIAWLSLIAVGAAKMGHLESLSLARVSAILSCVPILSPFLLLGIPFGIWSLKLLANPEIRCAFQSSKHVEG